MGTENEYEGQHSTPHEQPATFGTNSLLFSLHQYNDDCRHDGDPHKGLDPYVADHRGVGYHRSRPLNPERGNDQAALERICNGVTSGYSLCGHDAASLLQTTRALFSVTWLPRGFMEV
jgi:hypothetical protein